MPAPAITPPKDTDFPPALSKYLKPLLDYIKNTHIDDIKIVIKTRTDANEENTVDFTRGESGVIVNITLYGKTC